MAARKGRLPRAPANLYCKNIYELSQRVPVADPRLKFVGTDVTNCLAERLLFRAVAGEIPPALAMKPTIPSIPKS
jgi:hypothetical protein